MVLLTEGEVLERYVMIEAKRKRIWERKVRIERRKDRKRLAEEMARRMAEARIQKKVEQQGNEFGTCLSMVLLVTVPYLTAQNISKPKHTIIIFWLE